MTKFEKGFSNFAAFVVGDQKICLKFIIHFKNVPANFLEHQRRRNGGDELQTALL